MKKTEPIKLKVKRINANSNKGFIALAEALARQLAENDYKKDLAA